MATKTTKKKSRYGERFLYFSPCCDACLLTSSLDEQANYCSSNSLICPNFLVDLQEISGGSWSFVLQWCSSLCTDVPPPSEKKNGEKRVSSPDFFFWGRGDVCTRASHVAALVRCVLIGGLRGRRLKGKGKEGFGRERNARGAPLAFLAPKTPFPFPFKRLPRRLSDWWRVYFVN